LQPLGAGSKGVQRFYTAHKDTTARRIRAVEAVRRFPDTLRRRHPQQFLAHQEQVHQRTRHKQPVAFFAMPGSALSQIQTSNVAAEMGLGAGVTGA